MGFRKRPAPRLPGKFQAPRHQWAKQAEVSIVMQLMAWVSMTSAGVTSPGLLALLTSLCAGVIVRWAFPVYKSDFYITGGTVLQAEGTAKLQKRAQGGKNLAFFKMVKA